MAAASKSQVLDNPAMPDVSQLHFFQWWRKLMLKTGASSISYSSTPDSFQATSKPDAY